MNSGSLFGGVVLLHSVSLDIFVPIGQYNNLTESIGAFDKEAVVCTALLNGGLLRLKAIMKTPIYSGPNLETTHSPLRAIERSDAAMPHSAGEVITLGISSSSKFTQVVQRLLDIVFAFLGLLFLLPIFVIIALRIKLDSPGPILFIQKRVGKDGKIFPFYKFRSMVNDAESRRRQLEEMNERNGPVFKIRNDPRITKVGHFLRKYSIDELPQLINVLKGEMSLVGPRPALPAEVAQYTPRQMQRLAVTPGVTGLWQVSGRSNVSFEHSVELDLHYIQNQSLALNLRILLLTIPAVLTAEGAY